MKTFKLTALMALAAILFITGCKKDQEDYFVTPPSEAHFLNQSSGTLFLSSTNTSTRIRIGSTTVADRDRTVNVNVTSRTGAVEGTHYTLPSKTISIKAGQVIDSFTVSGILSQYLSGRKDTLTFRLTGGDGLAASGYNDSFVLALRGPCFEGEISAVGALASLRGTYANTRETYGTGAPYGPYTTTISAATQTSATTANITVTNIFDAGWAPITFTLDWTDINNRKITLVQQTGLADASTAFNVAPGAGTIQVGPASQVGTFSYCNQVLTLRMLLGITGVGYNSSVLEVVLRR